MRPDADQEPQSLRRREYGISDCGSRSVFLIGSVFCIFSELKITEINTPNSLLKKGATSLKEPQLSSAAWWIFCCTLRAGPENGRFLWFRTVKSMKIIFVASVVVTVFFYRGVLLPFFSLRLHPYTSLRGYVCCISSHSSSFGLTPNILLRPSRERIGRLNQLDARLQRSSPSGTSDWPCAAGIFSPMRREIDATTL